MVAIANPQFQLMRLACIALAAVSLAIWSVPAFAYRPFDGTDAAVANTGEVEIELQPAGVLRQGSQTNVVGPVTVVNIGVSKGWEAVFEGLGQFPLSSSVDRPSLTDVAAFLKGVVRPGSLQDQTGPSVATEFGVLLPGINAGAGFGASVAGIVSQRWDWGTVNLNVATALTRDHRADLLLGAIVEGPHKWPVRPVMEVFYEDEVGELRTVSALGGAIWQVKGDLSFDVGLRHALTNGQSVNEIRAGLTFALPANLLGSKSR